MYTFSSVLQCLFLLKLMHSNVQRRRSLFQSFPCETESKVVKLYSQEFQELLVFRIIMRTYWTM